MRIVGIIIPSCINEDLLLLELGGKPLIKHCIDSMMKYVCDIFYIGENNYKKLFTSYYNLHFISNDNFNFKLLNTDKALVVPNNYPLINPDTYKILLNEVGDIVIPIYTGISGYPILLNKTKIKQISDLNELLNIKNGRLIECADPYIRFKVDNRNDFYQIYRGLRFLTEEGGHD